MSALALLLIAKIGVTVIAASGPLLVSPIARIERQSGCAGAPTLLPRLYGMATLALLVGMPEGSTSWSRWDARGMPSC
ncbi:MAG: hypothetical protein AAGM38_16155 [Pseudomonadota bacterium]